jgi:hypothetical protein
MKILPLQKQKLATYRGKISALYNFHACEGETEFKKIIRSLDVTEPVGVISDQLNRARKETILA